MLNTWTMSRLVLNENSRTDEVWYHGYHISYTRPNGTGGPTMSRSTPPKGTGQEAHNRGGLEDNYRIKSYK
jgi:hypothetical protein